MKIAFSPLIQWLCVVFCTVLLSSCQKPINWDVTFDNQGKEPYGTYLFHQALHSYFPKNTILFQKSNTSFESIPINDQKKLFIQIGKNFYSSEAELNNLLSHINQGATLLLACEELDSATQAYFGWSTKDNSELNPESFRILEKKFNIKEQYFNPHSINNIIANTIHDTSYFIGYQDTLPNMIYMNMGKGTIIFHSNPLLFTNINMLHQPKQYIEHIVGLLQENTYDQVYFSSYLNHNTLVTDWDILWQYPAFKWAMIVLGFGLVILLIFETKRRQRIIPIFESTPNNTLPFIETIGRLYYNQGDLLDIAQKKIQYFLEFVRSKYYIDTKILDQQFEEKLIQKSKVDEHTVHQLVKLINHIQHHNAVTKEQVMLLDQYIKAFNHGY